MHGLCSSVMDMHAQLTLNSLGWDRGGIPPRVMGCHKNKTRVNCSMKCSENSQTLLPLVLLFLLYSYQQLAFWEQSPKRPKLSTIRIQSNQFTACYVKLSMHALVPATLLSPAKPLHRSTHTVLFQQHAAGMHPTNHKRKELAQPHLQLIVLQDSLFSAS